jgi:pimeloyl-ACP methyl ester carboxylesterase
VTVPYPYPEVLLARQAVEHEFDIDGVETHWWDYAAPTSGARAIVLVHGYRGDHHGLDLFARALTEFRVVIPDLPGFGSSESWDVPVQSIDDYGRWFREFLTVTNTRDAVIVGHSFGSVVVANGLRGERRSPIVLINPISQRALNGPRWFVAAVTRLWYRVGKRLPVSLSDAWLSNPLFVRIMSGLLAKTHDHSLRKWIHAQHAAFFSLYADRDSLVDAFDVSISSCVTDYAPEIHVPVLLIASDRDDVTPLSAQLALQQLFDKAELVVLTGVGHLVHYERPVEVADAIREFVSSSN